MEIRQKLKKLNTQSFIELYTFLKDFHDYLSQMDPNAGIDDYIEKETEKFCHWTLEEYSKLDTVCLGFNEHFTRGIFSYSMCTLTSFAEHGRAQHNSSLPGANQSHPTTAETAINQKQLKARDSVANLKKIHTREKRKAINLNANQRYQKFNEESEKLFSFREEIIEMGNVAIDLKSEKNDSTAKAYGNLLILFSYDILFLTDDYFRKLTEIKRESDFSEIKKTFISDVENFFQIIEQEIKQIETIELTSNKTNDLNILSQFFYDLISSNQKPNSPKSSITELVTASKASFASIMSKNEILEEKKATMPIVNLLNK